MKLGRSVVEKLKGTSISVLLPRPDDERALELMERMKLTALAPLAGGKGAAAGAGASASASASASAAAASKTDAAQVAAKVESSLAQGLKLPQVSKALDIMVARGDQDGKFVAAVAEGVCRHVGSIAAKNGGKQ